MQALILSGVSSHRPTSRGSATLQAPTDRELPRRSVDTRTRSLGESASIDAATFWETEWRRALGRNGERAASDAERLDLPPLAIAVDGEVWTLRRGDRTLEVIPGGDTTTLRVALDGAAFAAL